VPKVYIVKSLKVYIVFSVSVTTKYISEFTELLLHQKSESVSTFVVLHNSLIINIFLSLIILLAKMLR